LLVLCSRWQLRKNNTNTKNEILTAYKWKEKKPYNSVAGIGCYNAYMRKTAESKGEGGKLLF
jgi:hypothetical protein